jgi:hypothetical protein
MDEDIIVTLKRSNDLLMTFGNDYSDVFLPAIDEIELLRTKQKIAVGMIKELLDFLEFIYDHPEFPNSSNSYKWIMFQIEMMMAKYNEPVGEDR